MSRQLLICNVILVFIMTKAIDFDKVLKKCKSKNFANYEDYEKCLIDEVGEDNVEAVLLYDVSIE